jgi:hypothetical protein
LAGGRRCYVSARYRRTISSGLCVFRGIPGVLQRLRSLHHGGPLFRGKTKFTHACLVIRIDRKMNSMDVINVLTDQFILRGIPGHIRSRHGPEFIARAAREWIAAVSAGPHLSSLDHPGRTDFTWGRSATRTTPQPGRARQQCERRGRSSRRLGLKADSRCGERYAPDSLKKGPESRVRVDAHGSIRVQEAQPPRPRAKVLQLGLRRKTQIGQRPYPACDIVAHWNPGQNRLKQLSIL